MGVVHSCGLGVCHCDNLISLLFKNHVNSSHSCCLDSGYRKDCQWWPPAPAPQYIQQKGFDILEMRPTPTEKAELKPLKVRIVFHPLPQ